MMPSSLRNRPVSVLTTWSVSLRLFVGVLVGWGLLACVEPVEVVVQGIPSVLIVDGTLTDQPEAQLIRLSRSRLDPLSGRPVYQPVTGASVQVVVDSAQRVTGLETTSGRYQLPADFRGQTGHTYRLVVTLAEGEEYTSTDEQLQPVAPVTRLRAQFNPASLSGSERLMNVYTAAHEFYVDFSDPADQVNYYRWEWIDWERQPWCRSCHGGLYQSTDANGRPVEDCVSDGYPHPQYDYNCRTACWELVSSTDLVLFSDQFSNGSAIKARRVGRVPLFSKEPCLVEIRQLSLTKRAYQYFSRLNEQASNTGGVAGPQPALLAGNVHNVVVANEPVFGYFSVTGVQSTRYWLTRADATGFTPGLFEALTGRTPVNEESVARYRPPLAVCVPSDSRTPFKPDGWRD